VTEPKPDRLETAIIAVLRPVVRLVLNRGMAFGRFAELAKRAYVEAAKRHFSVPNRKLSISRVAVLTGLTRKEASRLMQIEPEVDEAAARRHVNRAARVVTAWVEDPTYHDGRGGPASLPFESDQGACFSDLVRTHGGDVTPRAVLDELLRVGAIGRLSDDRIRLIERAYIPSRDEAAKLEILGTDVADLVSSIDHNLDPESEPPFFQRKVAYDNLPAEYLPALRALLAERGQQLLEELNLDMADHDRDVQEDSETGPRHRAMVGLYYFEEESDEED
jgi:hypothetical protein